MMTDMTDDCALDDAWSYYFHDPAETRDWSEASYHRLGSVSTVNEFWRLQVTLRPYLQHGMFFMFREPIFPKWDHPLNVEGGCVSFKVVHTEIVTFLEDILIDVLRGDDLSTEAVNTVETFDTPPINGISISPKNGFVVVKIWMRDEGCKNKKLRLPQGYKGEVLWRSNRESLQVDARVVRSSPSNQLGRPGTRPQTINAIDKNVRCRRSQPGRPGFYDEKN